MTETTGHVVAPWCYQAINWGLIILGWLIINYQHNARETRKEIRAALDKIDALLEDIEQKAIAFHTSEDFDSFLLRDAKRLIARLPPHIQSIDFWSQTIGFNVTNIRRAATLRNAEPSEFIQQNPESDIVLEISSSIDNMRTDLNMEFRERYQAPFSWFKRARKLVG